MSKTLEEIQAEMSAPAPKPRAVQEILQELSTASGIPMDKMLNALDQAAPDQPELLPEGAKVYYTSFPNCGIMIQTGPAATERVEFKGDRLVTTDPIAIAYLDGIADKPGSTVYTKSHVQVTAEVQQMRADLESAARRAHGRMVASGERVS